MLLLLDPSLPIYGVVANLLAEPAAPFATVLGLVACLLAPVAPPIAGLVAWLAWVPASWIAAVATFTAGTARRPQSVAHRRPRNRRSCSALSVAAVVCAARRRARRGVRCVARSIVVIAFVAYLATLAGTRIVTDLSRPADWQFALCDVGQGDATVIRSGGAIALVDTGPQPAPLEACLDELGIDRIQLLVLTHYDLDHVGGVEAVLGRVDRCPDRPAVGCRRCRDRRCPARAGGADVDQVSTGERGIAR